MQRIGIKVGVRGNLADTVIVDIESGSYRIEVTFPLTFLDVLTTEALAEEIELLVPRDILRTLDIASISPSAQRHFADTTSDALLAALRDMAEDAR